MADHYLGLGIYSLTQAARLIDVPRPRLRRWVLGYGRKYKGRVIEDPPVIRRQLEDIDGEPVISFFDLIEARFVDAFKDHGLSLQAIRVASEKAAKRFHNDHPLSSRRFRTDGATIFAEVADETGEKQLLDLVRDQYAFERVLSPYLYAGLEFAGDDALLRWRPESGDGRVVLDPRRNHGQPIIEDAGVPTAVIAEAFEAGLEYEQIASWYEVSLASVESACEFERNLAA